MTNIWAKAYEEIRSPYFEMGDPYVVSEEKKEKEEKEEPKEKKHKEGSEEESKEKKSKSKRWWDDDGDGVGYEPGEVSGKFKKKVKEERELHSKNDKNERVDVRKGLKNKIEINPKLKEEVEAWVEELLDEGYDLSKFTWDEVSEIYESAEELDEAEYVKFNDGRRSKVTRIRGEFKKPQPLTPLPKSPRKSGMEKLEQGRKAFNKSREVASRNLMRQAQKEEVSVYDIILSHLLDEADSTMIPPKGDAQTMKPDPLQSAKRRAAQAQVRKELSDLQVAKARATAKLSPASEEAILSYLENRYDLSEGVFDPKKTRLKPASERRKTEMTPAQKKAAEMKQKRSERLEQEAEKILRQTRGTSSTRKSSSPMGSEPPKQKEAAPEANRKLKRGQKEDKLAKKASDVLKGSKG
jgi:hypothetical protein